MVPILPSYMHIFYFPSPLFFPASRVSFWQMLKYTVTGDSSVRMSYKWYLFTHFKWPQRCRIYFLMQECFSVWGCTVLPLNNLMLHWPQAVYTNVRCGCARLWLQLIPVLTLALACWQQRYIQVLTVASKKLCCMVWKQHKQECI